MTSLLEQARAYQGDDLEEWFLGLTDEERAQLWKELQEVIRAFVRLLEEIREIRVGDVR